MPLGKVSPVHWTGHLQAMKPPNHARVWPGFSTATPCPRGANRSFHWQGNQRGSGAGQAGDFPCRGVAASTGSGKARTQQTIATAGSNAGRLEGLRQTAGRLRHGVAQPNERTQPRLHKDRQQHGGLHRDRPPESRSPLQSWPKAVLAAKPSSSRHFVRVSAGQSGFQTPISPR